jgi:hypothetical protein
MSGNRELLELRKGNQESMKIAYRASDHECLADSRAVERRTKYGVHSWEIEIPNPNTSNSLVPRSLRTTRRAMRLDPNTALRYDRSILRLLE